MIGDRIARLVTSSSLCSRDHRPVSHNTTSLRQSPSRVLPTTAPETEHNPQPSQNRQPSHNPQPALCVRARARVCACACVYRCLPNTIPCVNTSGADPALYRHLANVVSHLDLYKTRDHIAGIRRFPRKIGSFCRHFIAKHRYWTRFRYICISVAVYVYMYTYTYLCTDF